MKILIIAMPGCGNLGDDLISELLQNHIKQKFPSAELGIMCGDRSNFKTVDNSLKIFRPRKSLLDYFKKDKCLLKFASECNLIFIGGGGLFQDSHSFYTIHSYLHPIFSANCPIVCVGIGVGPIKNESNKRYLFKSLNRSGIQIQLRDQESFDILEKIGLKNIELSCDIVEGSEIPLIKMPTDKKTLGCSLRKWNDLDENKIVGLINEIINTHQIEKVSFFAFEHSANAAEEYNFLESIASHLQIETKVFGYGKDSDFYSELGNIDLAIASRYHANIIWQKLGIPTMPIPYAPKVFSLYAKKGYKLYPFNSQKFVPEFVNIPITDRYALPEIDESQFVRFSFFEKITDRCLHFQSIIGAIIQSLSVRFFK